MKHIFGPVNSRRFGLSLGIDLSTSTKQCNFDCVYCELTRLKPQQKQQTITPPQDILDQLEKAFIQYPKLDVLTITANGEPTMYPHLEELIQKICAMKWQAQKRCQNAHSLQRIDHIQLGYPKNFKRY